MRFLLPAIGVFILIVTGYAIQIRFPPNHVADSGVMNVEVVGRVGRYPAATDKVVDCLNIRGAGHVRHGLSCGKRPL